MGFRILFGVAGALLFFLSLLIHELCHSFVAKAYGIAVPQIQLFLFGGVSNLAKSTDTPGKEFTISIVGPLSSAVLGGILFGLVAVFHSFDIALPKFLDVFLPYLAITNVALAVFNMLPVFPMDGGRILRSFLWKIWQDEHRATRVAAVTGKYISIVLMVFGGASFLLWAGTGIGFTGGLWIAFVGYFLKSTIERSWIAFLLDKMTLREAINSGSLLPTSSFAPSSWNDSLKARLLIVSLACSLDDTIASVTGQVFQKKGISSLVAKEEKSDMAYIISLAELNEFIRNLSQKQRI